MYVWDIGKILLYDIYHVFISRNLHNKKKPLESKIKIILVFFRNQNISHYYTWIFYRCFFFVEIWNIEENEKSSKTIFVSDMKHLHSEWQILQTLCKNVSQKINKLYLTAFRSVAKIQLHAPLTIFLSSS